MLGEGLHTGARVESYIWSHGNIKDRITKPRSWADWTEILPAVAGQDDHLMLLIAMASNKTLSTSGKHSHVAYSLSVKTDIIRHHDDGQDNQRIEDPTLNCVHHHQGQSNVQGINWPLMV